jgi:diguanylate cyclase (GGDEF)-like protein/putative nucleotidyltransferase with HDIG domain
MKQMSFSAWVYIWGVLVAGLALSALTLVQFEPSMIQWQTFATFTLLAVGAQLFEAAAPNRHAYYPSYVFFFAGVLLLPPALFVLVVLVPHLVEWIKARLIRSPILRDWYIQPFNIAMHIIAGMTARWMHSSLHADLGLFPTISPVFAVTMVALTYVVLNNVLLGLALVLARGISWRESGVLNLENVVSELIMLCLGYVVAVLWEINHWLILPALSPLGLMYRALQVPRLKEEARTDSKTGLWNARHFNTLFNAELERATRFNRPVAFIMADLDLLRDINNTYGHLAGDTVLTGIGTLLRNTIRDYDIAGRFGGEEFAIVMPEVGPIEARALAERIRQAIQAARFEVSTSPTPISVTMSFGIACFPADATSATDLIHEADAAVYQAKHQGRNRVVCARDVPLAVKLELERAASAAPTAPTADDVAPSSSAERTDVQTGPNEASAPVCAPAYRDAGAATLRPAPAQTVRERMQTLLTGSVIVSGIVLTLLSLTLWPAPQLTAIALLAGLAAIIELWQVQRQESAAVSPTIALIFASALIAGLPGVIAVSAALAIVQYVQHPALVRQIAFRWATHVLAGSSPALILSSLPLLPSLLPLMAAGLVYYLIQSALLSAAASFGSDLSFSAIWRDDLRRLTSAYLLWCGVGICMLWAYQAHALIGIVGVALPILLLRYSQKQAAAQIEAGARELQRLNQQLSRVQQELSATQHESRQLNGELLLTLANALDTRNPALDGHAARVAEYAAAIAGELGLPNSRVEQVRLAGLLHDLGKIGVSEQLLRKRGPLSEVEYLQVQSHAALGANLLEASQSLRQLAPFVKHHHERWDGGGYPSGLSGAQIPLEARILALCETVDALISPQPYRAALPLAQACAEIERCAGTQFDPQVVAAFDRIVARDGGRLFRSAEPIPMAGLPILLSAARASDDLAAAAHTSDAR